MEMQTQISSSSNSSSVNSTFSPSPDHLNPPSPISPSDQLCYVHCNYCDTVLAVSVPCSSLLKTVTVRCGHCTNLLSVNMRSHLLSPAAVAPSPNHFHSFFTSPPHYNHLLDEIRNAPPSMTLMNQSGMTDMMMMPVRHGSFDDLPKPPLINRPPEKRQRVPSAYNRFIKDEIQRIKAGNPDISHREAFSAAAKNWAHFPHIHFGLMPDQPVMKKTNIRQQEGGDGGQVMMKDGLFAQAAAANVGIYGP